MPLWVGLQGSWQKHPFPLGAIICPACKQPATYRLYWRERSIVGGVFSIGEVFSWDAKKRMLACDRCHQAAKCDSEPEAKTLFAEIREGQWESVWRKAAQERGVDSAAHALLEFIMHVDQAAAGASSTLDLIAVSTREAKRNRETAVSDFLTRMGDPTRAGGRSYASAEVGASAMRAPVSSERFYQRDRVERPVERGPDELYNGAWSPQECILLAGQFNDVEALSLALEAGAEPNGPPEKGWPPPALCGACGGGSLESVGLLLDAGADPNAVVDGVGGTPLTIAATSGYPRVVQVLLERGATVDQPNGAGRTALQLASEHHNLETAKVLLSAGADPEATDADGESAIDRAAAIGDEVMEDLLWDHVTS